MPRTPTKPHHCVTLRSRFPEIMHGEVFDIELPGQAVTTRGPYWVTLRAYEALATLLSSPASPMFPSLNRQDYRLLPMLDAQERLEVWRMYGRGAVYHPFTPASPHYVVTNKFYESLASPAKTHLEHEYRKHVFATLPSDYTDKLCPVDSHYTRNTSTIPACYLELAPQ